MERKNMYAAATSRDASNATPTRNESTNQFKDAGYNPGEYEENVNKKEDSYNCEEKKHSESQIGKLKDDLYRKGDKND